MKGATLRAGILILACVAGVATSEGLYRIERGRELVAKGVQQVIATAAQIGFPLKGVAPEERTKLRDASAGTPVSDEEIQREVDLIRFQIGDELHFSTALSAPVYSMEKLRSDLAEHLRAVRWLEEQIRPQLNVPETDARAFYEAHPQQFALPQRFRANHIFVAAPEGSQPEIIAAKQGAMQGIAVRLLAGENFADVAAGSSEDEATKGRGGDLGFFASERMPPEFMTEIEKLQPGQLSAPIRSHLGFHLVQLTEVKPARTLSFEEAQPEIALALANEKRGTIVGQIAQSLRVR